MTASAYGVRGTHREMLLALAQDASQKGCWEDYADSLREEYDRVEPIRCPR